MANSLYLWGYAGEQILVENEERLNRTNLTISIFDGKILIVESLSDCVFDQLVEAIVFALADEGIPPTSAMHQLRA
jgi:hypothetical protein